MRIRDIVKEVLQYGTSNVTITGGEPLIQRGTISLISTLKNKGLYVTIETNGSKFIPPSPRIRVSWVVDYKLPSSGMEHLMHFKNFRNLYDNDFIKFVITDRKDFDRSLEVLLEIREKLPYQRAAKVAFSPALGMNRKKLVTWMIESNYLKSIGAICNLQLHKLIGVS
jgi:7-carboxy-7-deazaguanine synthase